MLTPEQVREIRKRSDRMIRVHEMGAAYGTDAIQSARAILALLADRDETADRLQEVRMLIPNEGGGVAGRTLAALIERIRG